MVDIDFKVDVEIEVDVNVDDQVVVGVNVKIEIDVNVEVDVGVYVNVGFNVKIDVRVSFPQILKCFLSLRADSCQRLGIVQDSSEVKFSSYFACAERTRYANLRTKLKLSHKDYN